MAGMYDYEGQLADLQQQYAQQKAAQEYGRFVGQQRFDRNKIGLQQGFGRQFPKMTGALARRFGGNVRSGRVGADISQGLNDFGQRMNDLATDQAGWQGNWQTQNQQMDSAYQQNLMRLQEQLAAQRANQSPFQPYQAVWGGK